MTSPRESTVHPLSFKADGYRLIGELHLPLRPDPPIVIGSHGFMANRHSPKLIALAEQCTRCGIGFFRFDHRGCGESEGRFAAGTSLQARATDLLSAIAALQEQGWATHGIGLFGSSMGGATALIAAPSFPCKAVVSYAAPIRPPSLQDPTQARPTDAAEIRLIGEKRIRFDARFELSAIHHLLVFHGDQDAIVPLDNGREIYGLAQRPKRMIRQRGGDHLMSNPIHQAAFVREAVYWFIRCLLPEPCPFPAAPS